MQSVSRAFDVLFAIARAEQPSTVGSLASSVGLPRSTVHRILDTLIEAGVVARDRTERAYVVTPKLALATLVSRKTATLADTMLPSLHRLVALGEETASLHIRVGDLRVCAAEVEGSRGLRWARGTGWAAPIWVGAVGRTLMAGESNEEVGDVLERCEFRALAQNTVTDPTELLEIIGEIRAKGWAASYSETVDGAAAVAAPIVAAGGRTIAAISLYASVDRLDHMTSLVPELCEVAREAGVQWDAISAVPRELEDAGG